MPNFVYSCRIADEAEAFQAAEDADVLSWVKENEIVFATGLETTVHAGWAATITLEWENTTDNPGTWTALGASGEVQHVANPNYADGDAITHGNEGLTPVQTTHVDGRKIESAGSWAGFSLARFDHQELRWAITLDNALDGKQYTFRINDGSATFPCLAQITTFILVEAAFGRRRMIAQFNGLNN